MKTWRITFFLVALLPVYANAQQGWVLQSTPLGPVGPPTPATGKVQFVSATKGWITVEDGRLLHTTNAGALWTMQTPGGSDTIVVGSNPAVSLSFISATTGWLIGALGSFDNARGAVVYKTTNAGGTWSRQMLSQWSAGLGIQFVDANNGWAWVLSGNFPTDFSASLIRSTNGGNTWSTVSTFNRKFLLFHFIDPNNGWGIADSVGTGPGDFFISPSEILRTTNGGETWVTQHRDNTPGTYEAIHFVDANNGWVVGEKGKILRTTNGGTTWSRVTNAGITSNSNCYALYFLNANTGWIGNSESTQQQVLRTTDGGASWTTQSVPVQHAIFSIHFVDASNGWLSSDYGGIAYTTTGGVTSAWQDDSPGPPARFALSQNYPNPFNPKTEITFALPEPSTVRLTVLDLLGREVAMLEDRVLPAGYQTARWNGRNAKGEPVGSGLYFYRINAVGESGRTFFQTMKMVMAK